VFARIRPPTGLKSGLVKVEVWDRNWEVSLEGLTRMSRPWLTRTLTPLGEWWFSSPEE